MDNTPELNNLRLLAQKLPNKKPISNDEFQVKLHYITSILTNYLTTTKEINDDTRKALQDTIKEADALYQKVVGINEEHSQGREALLEQMEAILEEGKKLVFTPGEKGESGEIGPKGEQGERGQGGERGKDGTNGIDGLDGKGGKDGSPDTAVEIVDKINNSDELIEPERVNGLVKILDSLKDKAVSTVVGGVRLLSSLLDVSVSSPTNGQVLTYDSTINRWKNTAAAGGVTDGDKGDVTVTASGATWTIDNGVVTNAKSADMATKTYKGRTTAGTGVSEDVPVATLKTDLVLVKADVGLGNVVNTDTTTTANIVDSLNKRFVTDANLTTIGNQSGVNTGDNAVNTLYSGLVSNANHTGDASGATALTLATVNANVGSFGLAGSVAQFTVNAKGLITAALNVAISITASQVSDFAATVRSTVLTGLSLVSTTVISATDTVLVALGSLQAQITALTTTVSGKASTATTISTTAPLAGGGDLSANRTLTTSMATNKLIGRGTAGTGVMEEITLGTNLSFTGTTLNAAGGGTSTVQDEGVTQSTAVTTFNFTGAGVTASGAGATATINIPGGAGSTVSGQATVDFGAKTNRVCDTAVVTVATASVVTASIINVSPYGGTTADHDPEDVIIEEIQAYATNIVNGVSFDIIAIAPNNSWGKYLINYQFT